MPFEELETFTKAPPRTNATISYMPATRKRSADERGPLKLNVTLPTTVFISKSAKFKVLIGTGADSDKLRIIAHNDGIKPVEFKSHVIFRFGRVPALGDDMFDGTDCKLHRVADDVYEITAPGGLLKDAAVAVLRKKVKAA